MSKIFLACYTVFTFLAVPTFAGDPETPAPDPRICANYVVGPLNSFDSKFSLEQRAHRGQWEAGEKHAWPINQDRVVTFAPPLLSVFNTRNQTVTWAQGSVVGSFGAPFGSSGFYYLTEFNKDDLRHLLYFSHNGDTPNSNDNAPGVGATFLKGRQFVWGSRQNAGLLAIDESGKTARYSKLSQCTDSNLEKNSESLVQLLEENFSNAHISRSGQYVYLEIKEGENKSNEGALFDLSNGTVERIKKNSPVLTLLQVMDDGTIAYFNNDIRAIIWENLTIRVREGYSPLPMVARGDTLITWSASQVNIYNISYHNSLTLNIDPGYGKISHLDIPPNGYGINNILVLTDTGKVLRTSLVGQDRLGNFGRFLELSRPEELHGNPPVFAALLGSGDQVLLLGPPIATVPGGVIELR